MTHLKFIIGCSFENSLRQTNAMKVRLGNPTFILPHTIYFLNAAAFHNLDFQMMNFFMTLLEGRNILKSIRS